MKQTMPKTAMLYLKNYGVLEEARKTMDSCLDDLWKAIKEKGVASWQRVAEACSVKLDLWEVQAKPGNYKVSVENSGSPIGFYLWVCDPRYSDVAGQYYVGLYCDKGVQKQLSPAAKKHIEEQAKTRGVNNLAFDRKKELAVETVEVSFDDLDKTADSVVALVEKFFDVAVQSESWIAKNKDVAIK